MTPRVEEASAAFMATPMIQKGGVTYVVANEAWNAVVPFLKEAEPLVGPTVGREYPDEMDEHLKFILGMPNFQCAPIAHALREGGAEIATRSEAEQAYVLHWMIKLALDHPKDWRERVGKRLQEIADAAKAKQ